MKKTTAILAILGLAALGAQAAVTVTDEGLTAPTLGANDTGYTAGSNNRFGWDNGESVGQTFTVATAGTIDAIYLGYNGFDDGDTLTVDLSVNGTTVATGILLDGNNFSGNSGSDGNTGPFYWMKFDLSAENVPVNAGSNDFSMVATAQSGSSWALAPRYDLGGTPYDGGQATGTPGGANNDMAFAVTVVPEPSALLLLGLSGLGLLRRRRA